MFFLVIILWCLKLKHKSKEFEKLKNALSFSGVSVYLNDKWSKLLFEVESVLKLYLLYLFAKFYSIKIVKLCNAQHSSFLLEIIQDHSRHSVSQSCCINEHKEKKTWRRYMIWTQWPCKRQARNKWIQKNAFKPGLEFSWETPFPTGPFLCKTEVLWVTGSCATFWKYGQFWEWSIGPGENLSSGPWDLMIAFNSWSPS